MKVPTRIKAIRFCILAIGIPILAGCTSRTYDETAIFVENAKLSEAALHSVARKSAGKTSARPVHDDIAIIGHRISRGEGVVLGTRALETAYRLFPPVDYASFNKMTIYFPRSLASIDGEVDLTAPGITALWSDSSATIVNVNGCIGYITTGHMRVRSKTSTVVTAEVDAEFSPRRVWGGEECEPVQIKKVYKFVRVDLDDLTSWQGKRHENVRYEIMPF